MWSSKLKEYRKVFLHPDHLASSRKSSRRSNVVKIEGETGAKVSRDQRRGLVEIEGVARIYNKIQKQNAFTMMDILTGMVVMSIVVAMVFYLLTAVNQQHHNYSKVRIELNDFMLMHADIKRQVDLAERIHDIPNGFVLEGQDALLKYYLSGEILLRESEHSVDVLHKHVTGISFKYGEENTPANKLITQISIKTKLQEQEINAYFFKEYSKAATINHQLLNEL